jgi:UDP-N-acetylglucosamine--N-acetylmuramyl-(pentapeptide) pyrophosphoryl-undecaprenol N-acetylglucosamine transferase
MTDQHPARPTIVFAGGGTGGHVFPLLAVADALRSLAPVRIVVVGTARGLEAKLVPERGYELELMDVLPMRGGGPIGAVRGAMRAISLTSYARALLRRHAARAVFSVGGYAAGPTSLAARTLGIPLALLEPNGEIGLANRLIAPFVQRAYTAFEPAERHFPKRAVLRTGVPIRSGFEPQPYVRVAPRVRVLVIGGSQGARAINEVMPDAAARAKTPLHIVHQAGRGNDAGVKERYATLGLSERVEVRPFIDDMPAALAQADLVIGRAGAGAVSEICAVGRPSILIPYPHAGDHQRINAKALADAGATLCLLAAEASSERLAAEIDRLSMDPATLTAMAERARALGKPHAAHTIARDLLDFSRLAADAPEATKSDGGASGSGPLELRRAD